MLKWMGRIVVLALGAATAYEIVDALGFGDWRVLGWSTTVGVIALLAAAVLAFIYAATGRVPAIAAVIAPVAGAFLLAHFFSYDSYFGSGNVRRFSEGRPGAAEWIAVTSAFAVVAGIITRRSPRVGAWVTTAVPFVVFLSLVATSGD